MTVAVPSVRPTLAVVAVAMVTVAACGAGTSSGGSGAHQATLDGAPSVTVGTHTYLGRYTAASREFLGVQYAQQPVGPLRWYPPQPLDLGGPPVTTHHGQRFGPMCIQSKQWVSAPAPNPDGTPQAAGENCLVLNIYTPRNATAESRLPVLVFGHGGGDGVGASSMGRPLLLNGSNSIALTSTSTPHVSVTINYRLNTFGYLAHPAFASEKGGSVGQFGLLDHHAALTFVNKHIDQFGGDPGHVLFYGQSSGANHALWIPVMPHFKGLVQAAASHSACAQPFYNPDCALKQHPASATSSATEFATAHNCSGDDAAVRVCLRAIPAPDIKPGGDRPYVDGKLLADLPYNLYAKGHYGHQVTIMAGHNSGESVEMADSCLNHPTLGPADAPASLLRAVSQHNHIAVPPWLGAEAQAMYLPPRHDGLPPCTARGNASVVPPLPRCCRVYEDFWQDVNMQCSEDVLFTAIVNSTTRSTRSIGSHSTRTSPHTGAAPPLPPPATRTASVPPPAPLYAWRFDQVQDCPPALSGWAGRGYGQASQSNITCMYIKVVQHLDFRDVVCSRIPAPLCWGKTRLESGIKDFKPCVIYDCLFRPQTRASTRWN